MDADLYDAPRALDSSASFDRVFVTWGAINWLPDIAGWARVVAHFLKHGGFLYLADQHPTAFMFDDAKADAAGMPGLLLPYFADGPLPFDAVPDYANQDAVVRADREHVFAHPLGAIVTALADAGLRVGWLPSTTGLPGACSARWCPIAAAGGGRADPGCLLPSRCGRRNHSAKSRRKRRMSIAIRPVHPVFVGEVSGVDISRPLDAAAVAAIEAGMDRYAVLVFRDQPLTDEQQLRFGQYFGELEGNIAGAMTKPGEHRIAPQLADVSNLDRNNERRGRDDMRRLYSLGNRLWHSDASFRAVGAKYSMLSARVVPSRGGNTEFADMRAAYDALDDATRAEIEDLVTEHSIAFSRAELGFTDFGEHADLTAPVRHRLVRTHPVTGRKSLYLSAHIGGIVGWPVPEARAFLRDLTELATQRPFVYAHEWRVNDLVIWDNRQTMHRARRYDDLNERRDMRRTTIKGEGLTAPQVSNAA